jgi:hypothetical protein
MIEINSVNGKTSFKNVGLVKEEGLSIFNLMSLVLSINSF